MAYAGKRNFNYNRDILMKRIGACADCGQNMVSCGCRDKNKPFVLDEETLAKLLETSKDVFTRKPERIDLKCERAGVPDSE